MYEYTEVEKLLADLIAFHFEDTLIWLFEVDLGSELIRLKTLWLCNIWI